MSTSTPLFVERHSRWISKWRFLGAVLMVLGAFWTGSSTASGVVATSTTTVDTAPFTYDGSSVARVDVHEFDDAPTRQARLGDVREGSASPSDEARDTSTTPNPSVVATEAADEVFHYTRGEFVESISSKGLLPGSYATPNGSLSPLQAQIDLALPPNTGLRDAVLRVDVAGLRQAGYEIPSITRVSGTVTGPGGRGYTMPGGGYEMQFPYAIPPEFIKVVTP